ncbi:trypsin-like peptidase domain-containing protein [Paraburkholderia silvatlantica]|uniref:trypsin-like peptidase domain-containing protein n=1 Tax=Paraburkholderia silvatlantica TaxID=321895 RepID=UPI00105FAB31|nr:trypsin-like peptidase domain-containing protein [Paraburkholderia silvatlantica]TDQ86793.1 S1-C subfamily serine protease [Paraburkholderia silvatlantica]
MLRLIFARTSRPAAALVLALASAFCYEANAATPPPAATKPPASKAAVDKAANDKAAGDKAAASPKATAEASAPAAMAAPDFFSLAERYGPAVVHVIAHSADDPSAPPEQEAIDADDPFFAFFRRAPKPASDAEASGPRVMTGAGSGFIVSPDGVVLTTAHIVDNAEQVIVQLTDKREFKAEVVAVDPQSDVAVLQIDAHDLPFVKLADTAKVHPGEPVLSIGSPDSYQNTVTTGILSATSRTLPDGKAFPFLQTDVAVNPDNSGGPIFNRAGEVIGIDVQIYADGGRYQGLTFAIPIDAANQFRAQLQARKAAPAGSANAAKTTNPGDGGTIRTFGMQVEDVSPGLAAALGLPHAGGALVDAVDPASPIGKAGIRTGDVIVQVGTKPVDRAATLAAALAAVPPATPASLKVIRNRQPAVAGFSNTAFDPKAADADAAATGATGAEGATAAQATAAAQAAEKTDAPVATAVAAAVGKAPPSDVHAVKTVMTDPSAQPAAAAAPAPRHAADRLGLIAHALSAEEKRSTGLPLGLMVEASTGPAASAGVRAGDVVLSLDDTLVESQEEAVALEAKATKSMSLLIQRNNARSFVAVKLR